MRLGRYRLCAYACGLVLLLCCATSAAQRMVFAHYMLTNQDYQGDSDPTQEAKIAAYEREIRKARALGIDGFALNAGGWSKEPYYVRYAAQMFEAAARLHNGFKLMFSVDFCCGNTAADFEDMMRRFANNPRYADVYFKQNGSFVVTTFAGDKLGVDAWKQIRADLVSGAHPSTTTFPNALASVRGAPNNKPIQIFLVPAFFLGGETPDRKAVERGVKEWRDVIDGAFYWGIAGVPGSGRELDPVRSSDAYADALHPAKLYMAPVALQFWGANADRYYEYSGGAGMRAMWMDTITRAKPDWVEIITWNDFIEGTYISPIDDPNQYAGANFLNSSGVPMGTRGYFHSHAAAGELMSYFIYWYKTGIQPTITNDTIFWFYRTQPASVDAGVPSVKNKYGPVADFIYVTANLTAPATLRIESGDHVTSLKLDAGSHDVSAPFVAGGAPKFTLLHGRHVVLEASGADRIETSQYNNFYYSTGSARADESGESVK